MSKESYFVFDPKLLNNSNSPTFCNLIKVYNPLDPEKSTATTNDIVSAQSSTQEQQTTSRPRVFRNPTMKAGVVKKKFEYVDNEDDDEQIQSKPSLEEPKKPRVAKKNIPNL